MLKRLLKDSATYGIGRIAAALFGFATLPILTSHLSTVEYGIVDLLILCVTLFNLSVALEISQGVARFTGDARNHKEQSLYTSTALFFSVGMYTIAGSLIFIFQNDIYQILFKGKTDEKAVILFLIPWFILHGINYFVTNQLRWENKALSFVLLKSLNGFLMLLSIIVLLWQQNMGIKGVLFSYLFSLSVTSLIGIYLLAHNKSLSFIFCTIKLKEMLAFSLPLVPSSAAVFAQNYIDRIMITKMLDLSDLGLYSFAFKIASLVTLFSMTFQMSVTPLVYQLHGKKETPAHISQTFNIYLFLIFTVIIGICFFTPELFYFFIGKEFYASANLIPILCFAVFLSGIVVFSPGMAIAKKTKNIATINIVGMLINIVLNFVFIKHFGLTGAAIATVISLVFVAILTFFTSLKYYSIPYNYLRITLGTIFCVTSLIFITFNQTISGYSSEQLVIKIFIYIILTILLCIILLPTKTIIPYFLKKN